MITTNIDGSAANGSNQLLDLLSLVANPDAYASKVKSLEELIKKNQTFVELVAPASDIMTLRDQVRAELEKASDQVAAASEEASQIISAAKKEAASIRAAAKAKADKITEEAEQLLDAHAKAMKEVQELDERTRILTKEAEKAAADLKSAKKAADKARAEADEDAAAAQAMKADLIAKHKAFLESVK